MASFQASPIVAKKGAGAAFLAAVPGISREPHRAAAPAADYIVTSLMRVAIHHSLPKASCTAPRPVAVRMVGWLHDRLATRGQRASVQVIAIRHIEIEHALHGLIRSVGLADLQVRSADLHGHMLDDTIRGREAAQDLGVEGALEEVDYRLGAQRMQERLDVRSALPLVVPLQACRDVPGDFPPHLARCPSVRHTIGLPAQRST